MTEPITPEHGAAELERRAARKLLAEYFEHGDGGEFYDRVKLFLAITTDPSAPPVPAVEHQAVSERIDAIVDVMTGGGGTRDALIANLIEQRDAARHALEELQRRTPIAGHADIATHQRYRGAEPSVRFVEPQREAFIALYEAADRTAALLVLGEWESEEADFVTSLREAESKLKGALDKAAPAYGQALVARAERRDTRDPMKTSRGWDHVTLHEALDVLAAAFIGDPPNAGRLLSGTTVLQLIEWSFEKTKETGGQ